VKGVLCTYVVAIASAALLALAAPPEVEAASAAIAARVAAIVT
jgi:hypothetical protein